MVVLLVGIFSFMALMDLPALIREKNIKEIIVYGIFFVLAFVMSMLLVFGVEIPSPVKFFEFIIGDVLHLSYE